VATTPQLGRGKSGDVPAGHEEEKTGGPKEEQQRRAEPAGLLPGTGIDLGIATGVRMPGKDRVGCTARFIQCDAPSQPADDLPTICVTACGPARSSDRKPDVSRARVALSGKGSAQPVDSEVRRENSNDGEALVVQDDGPVKDVRCAPE
jgi:hypothetical protein